MEPYGNCVKVSTDHTISRKNHWITEEGIQPHTNLTLGQFLSWSEAMFLPFGLLPLITFLGLVSSFGRPRTRAKTHTSCFHFLVTCVMTNRTVGVQSRTTPAYFGRFMRAAATSSRSVVHCATSGVGSTLRLQCRLGVLHRRVAPLRSPLRASRSTSTSTPSFMSSRLLPFPGLTACQRFGIPFFDDCSSYPSFSTATSVRGPVFGTEKKEWNALRRESCCWSPA